MFSYRLSFLSLGALAGICMFAAPQPRALAADPAPKGESDAIADAFKLPPMGLESDMKAISKHLEELDHYVKSADQIQVRVGKISHWSVGQQTMHIARTMNFIMGGIDNLLANPTKDADAPTKPIRAQILTGGKIPRGVGKAPEQVAIHFQPTLDQVKTEIAQAKEHYKKLSTRGADIEACKATFPHFAFGPMTAKDWVRLIAIHDAHHLAIIADIEKAQASVAAK